MATGPAEEADGIIKLFCRTSRVAKPRQMGQCLIDSFPDHNARFSGNQSNGRAMIVSRFLFKIKDVDIEVTRQL